MAPSRPSTTLRTFAAVVALVSALAGCGLRVETPPPSALTPDANEAARQRGVADAVGLELVAATPAVDPADAVTDWRTTVVAHAGKHLDQLGGVYESGLETPEPTGSAAPAASPEPVAPPEPVTAPTDAVVAQLVQSAATARADALSVPDGELARLLASIAAERLLSARHLAAAAALAVPELPGVVPGESAPAGVSASALSSLVVAEDSAGFGYEVIAAKQSESARARALDRAAAHRSRAEEWATLAGISRTGLDPRRTAYSLPAGLDDAATATALAQSMETTLAAAYAAMVASADPDSRGPLVDAVAEAAAAAGEWGAARTPFPGLPERIPPA